MFYASCTSTLLPFRFWEAINLGCYKVQYFLLFDPYYMLIYLFQLHINNANLISFAGDAAVVFTGPCWNDIFHLANKQSAHLNNNVVPLPYHLILIRSKLHLQVIQKSLPFLMFQLMFPMYCDTFLSSSLGLNVAH